MKLLIAAIFIALILPVWSQSGSLNNHTAVSRAESVTEPRDTLLIPFYRPFSDFKDTIIQRPLYWTNDPFIERLLDSFYYLDHKFPNIFFQNPINPNNYFLSIKSAFSIINKEYSKEPFSFDCIDGLYCSDRIKNGIIIYNIDTDVLHGFGFEKTADVYLRIVNALSDEVFNDYILSINTKKRDGKLYQFGIFDTNYKKIDYDCYDNLKWINDVGNRPDSCDISSDCCQDSIKRK